MNRQQRVLGVINSSQHVLEFESLDLLVKLLQVVDDFLGNALIVALFGKFNQRPGILGEGMELLPGFNPVLACVDFLQDLLGSDVVVPEIRLMRFCLKLYEFSLFRIEVKDTPSAIRVAFDAQQVFLSGLQT